MDSIRKNDSFDNFPVRITDDIWLLGNYYINLYLVKGKNFSALVELGVTAIVESVVDQLQSLDVSPDYLVLTHPHADHITGLPELMKRFPKSRLLAGAGSKQFALHPEALKAMVFEDRFISTAFQKLGYISNSAAIDTLTFPEGYIRIGDKTEIDLGDLTLKCIPLPGHCPGYIAIYIPEKRTLFASDALGFHYPGRGFCPLFFTGFNNYTDSLWILESLKAEIVALGHQGPIIGQNVKTAFRETRKETNSIIEIVRDYKMDADRLARELFQRYYVDEFTLYSARNIMNCCRLLVRRAREKLQEQDNNF